MTQVITERLSHQQVSVVRVLSVGNTNLAGFRPSSRNPHKSVCDMQFNQIVSTARRRQIGHHAHR
jgi:hypothetical protein